MNRNKLIAAAAKIDETLSETGTYLRASGAYGSCRIRIVDADTGEEMNYEEARLLQVVPERGEDYVPTYES